MGSANCKIIRKRRPGKLERRVQRLARRRATRQLMRVPWDRFHKAYEEHLRWEALALWARTIVEAEGGAPSLLVTTLKKRCPGFVEKEAFLNEPRLLGFHFHEWIHNHIFGFAKREGWLDALTFYGARDLRSQSTWAYWEYCEQEWHHKRPASYPSFENWLRWARNYSLPQQRSVANLADAVERYVEWKIFDCWFEPLLSANLELPTRIVVEVERRCPGFLAAGSAVSMTGRGEQGKTQRRLMTWIEDHFFSDAKKKVWFDLIRQQACMHPGYARIVQYSKRWERSWSQRPALAYPAFAQWRRVAENYVED